MAKKSVPKSQSAQVYANMQTRGPRDMGRTADGDRHTIPSSTYRSLESVIPAESLRTRERYDYNPRTGKGKMVKERMDVMDEAREHINCGRFHVVTDGARQRRLEQDQREGDKPVTLGGTRSYMESSCPASPSALSGDMKRKRRY